MKKRCIKYLPRNSNINTHSEKCNRHKKYKRFIHSKSAIHREYFSKKAYKSSRSRNNKKCFPNYCPNRKKNWKPLSSTQQPPDKKILLVNLFADFSDLFIIHLIYGFTLFIIPEITITFIITYLNFINRIFNHIICYYITTKNRNQ